MNSLVPFLLVLPLALALSGCGEIRALPVEDAPAPPPAATFRPGHGLQLTPMAREFVGLATAEFTGRLPAEARLRTVEGDFVYVANGPWLIRTPIELAESSGLAGEVVSGLYEGDVVVTRGVSALWLAELHFLRAGQACAHDDGD